MTKKEMSPGRTIHRIDLTLPIVQRDAYEIFCSIPSTHNLRTLCQKPFIDNDNNKKSTNLPTRNRCSARLKHLLGPPFVNLFIDVNTMTAETVSTITDTISNPSYRNRVLKNLPKINKQKHLKDDGDQSRSSADDRLLYESVGSFDDQNKYKSKNNNMWQNIHHPQLTTAKTLHTRRMSKRSLCSNDLQSKVSYTASLDNLSQVSTPSNIEQLYERIEQLTKNYFPTIRKIRHSRPTPELINNRIHLHRVQEKNPMPLLSRTRAVQ
ncbi:unnamed protein product [Adineta steineri]|uniref:Uncharacterized protein n=1 Tax=Adineta steineri TaxID=433720 RepID=A0A819F9C5_9BILA|nr:unnamed protein product [Adineta steineri]CAF3864411.1 unnamed protein product [Adineta steineri]